MKILFLCKRYYTNKDLLKDGFGRLFHLPIGLSRLGAQVQVHALDYRNSQAVSINHAGVAFDAVPATVSRLPQAYRNIKSLVRRVRPDIIVASGDSHIGYLGTRLASDVGARSAFDVYDYYPTFGTNRIPGMRRLFETAVRRADVTLCASKPLVEKLAAISMRSLLVENGVDRTVFRPYDMLLARKEMQLPSNTPLIGYFGSMTPTRGPLLFEAVSRLKPAQPEVTLVLAGTVRGISLPTESVIYKGELPQGELPRLISACDVVTVPYARSEFNDMAGPCKIAEYLACGTPVVATRVAGHETDFENFPESLCEPDPDDLASALLRQLNSPRVAEFPKRLDWTDISTRLHKELASLYE